MSKFTNKVKVPTDVASKHQLRVARESMKMHCWATSLMGGPNHYEAASIIHQLTGVIVGIDAPCTCQRSKSQ